MIRQTLITTALVSIFGCSAQIQPIEKSARGADESAQLAAYAATANLPRDFNPRNDLQVGAVVDRSTGAIHLYNYTDRPLAGGNLWVNRTYVTQFGTIPARGHVVIPRNKFYDRTGQSFASVSTPPESVQLQWENDVYTLQGPVFQ